MSENIAAAIAAKNEVIAQQGTSLDDVAAVLETKAAGGTDISLGLTSAAVGQIIKVKAVDESGKPTAWETAYDKLPNPTSSDILSVLSVDQIGEFEYGYVFKPMPNINDFISLEITSASPGQFARVKYVDDTGKPTAWEAADMPSGGGDTLLYHYDTSEDAIITSTALMPNLDISTTTMLLFKWHINGYGTAEFGGRLMINNLPITKYFPYIHRKAGDTVDILCVVAVLDASLTVIKFIADSNYFTNSADFVYENGDSSPKNVINIPNSGTIESFGIQGATVAGIAPQDKGEPLDYTTSGFSVDVYKVV